MSLSTAYFYSRKVSDCELVDCLSILKKSLYVSLLTAYFYSRKCGRHRFLFLKSLCITILFFKSLNRAPENHTALGRGFNCINDQSGTSALVFYGSFILSNLQNSEMLNLGFLKMIEKLLYNYTVPNGFCVRCVSKTIRKLFTCAQSKRANFQNSITLRYEKHCVCGRAIFETQSISKSKNTLLDVNSVLMFKR